LQCFSCEFHLRRYCWLLNTYNSTIFRIRFIYTTSIFVYSCNHIVWLYNKWVVSNAHVLFFTDIPQFIITTYTVWEIKLFLNHSVTVMYLINIVDAFKTGTYLREWLFRLRGHRTLNWLVWSASSSHRRTFWSIPNPIPWSLVPRPIGKWMAGLGRDCKKIIIKKNRITIWKSHEF